MYSMFDLFFDTPAYSPVYLISDSEMKELQRTQNQEELDGIINQKKRPVSYTHLTLPTTSTV